MHRIRGTYERAFKSGEERAIGRRQYYKRKN